MAAAGATMLLIRHRETHGILHRDTLKNRHIASVRHNDIILERDLREAVITARRGGNVEQHIGGLTQNEEKESSPVRAIGRYWFMRPRPIISPSGIERCSPAMLLNLADACTRRANLDAALVARRIAPRRNGRSRGGKRNGRHEVIVKQFEALERTRRLVVALVASQRHLEVRNLWSLLDILQELAVKQCLNRHKRVSVVRASRRGRCACLDRVIHDHTAEVEQATLIGQKELHLTAASTRTRRAIRGASLRGDTAATALGENRRTLGSAKLGGCRDDLTERVKIPSLVGEGHLV
jgi:hypothetical protein